MFLKPLAIFFVAAFEDVAHTVEQRAIQGDARHTAAELLPDFHEGEARGLGQRMFGEPRDEGVVVDAAGGLATLGPQAPNGFQEMNPEVVRLSSHQRKEHPGPHGIAEPLTLEGEAREKLPLDQGQGVEFGVHSIGRPTCLQAR